MASNASDMLEAALEQMDNIIAGKMGEALLGAPPQKNDQGTEEFPLPLHLDSALEAVRLTEVLRAVLEGQEREKENGEEQEFRKQLSDDTARVILKWLRGEEESLRSSANCESYQERLSRLEGDKESLILQVNVLTEQVEAQGVKISDLEASLMEYQHKLNCTEDLLQQELLQRTSLENQKLSLLGEISYLKVKLADMEGKQSFGSERQHKAETVVNFISELQEQMCQFQREINSKIREKKAWETVADSRCPTMCNNESADGSQLKLSHDSTSEKIPRPEDGSAGPDGNSHSAWEGSTDTEQPWHCEERSVLLRELKILKDKVEHLEDQKQQYEKKLKATKVEVNNLQKLLLTKNAEIESLHTQLMARPNPTTDSSEKDQELLRLKSGMKSLLAAHDEKDRRIEELTLLLNQCRQFRDNPPDLGPAPSAVHSLSNGRSSSLSSEEEDQSLTKIVDSNSAASDDLKSEGSTNSRSSQQSSPLSTSKDDDSRSDPQALLGSVTDVTNGLPSKGGLGDSTNPAPPVKASLSEQNELEENSTDVQRSPDGSEDGNSSQSLLEKVDDSTSSESSPAHSSTSAGTGQRAVGSPEYMKNNRSLKRLWGKLRRTQSGGFQAADQDAGQFRRGGLRATAGPRLTRSHEHDSTRDMNIPFCQWSKEQVCSWLEDYGLGQYVNLTRQWVENGQTLLSATQQDFEKEMGMRHPLHRKKLQLALRAFTTKVVEQSSELDHIWVTRWLDDIGLPQYKDQFHEARVDGRILQYLTVNDLLTLKVTSQLHHLSIKCAIHVLHVNKFNPNCLRRRPGDEKQPSPSEVVQWSNHRVMEWLRAVDLAEYAPNLRGSGVHGGLIILEPRFSSETLALLLNIPPQKTLLRRHLATAFASLVGLQAMQEKREYGNATGHVPLTTTAKVKPKKLGFTQFSHLRKRRPDDADYICQIDNGTPALNGVSRLSSSAHRTLNLMSDRSEEK